MPPNVIFGVSDTNISEFTEADALRALCLISFSVPAAGGNVSINAIANTTYVHSKCVGGFWS